MHNSMYLQVRLGPRSGPDLNLWGSSCILAAASLRILKESGVGVQRAKVAKFMPT